ncbi:MAG: DUF5668 domain-containing protein [bacterium]
MFVGSMLLILGLLMLLDRMGIITGDAWDYFWPVAVIALGVSMLFSAKRKTGH